MKYLNSIVLAIFLTACTDYVQQMDEDFEEWELAQELANSSSSSQKVKSSSSLKSSSSETSSSSAKSSSSAGSSSSAEAPVSSNVDKVSSSSVIKPAESSSSSVVYVEPCNVNGVDKCEYGTLVDSRDGKKYKTVTIGTQIWMAQNLSYDDSYSWCYGGSAANCDKYGRMYTWAMAMDSVGRFSDNSKGCGYPTTLCNAEPPVRGICPEGWHIPTKDEFKILIKAVGGGETPSVLQSKEYWRGAKDSYGFSVIPIMGFTSSRSAIIEDLAVIWGSSIDASDGRSDALGINETGIFVYPDDSGPDHGNAIRCVSDKSVMPKLSSSSSAKSSSSSAVVPQSSSSSVTVSSSSEKEVSSSSSEIVKSSSSGKASWAYLNPAISYGEMTDDRDGQVYKTVVIGEQTWMAENLNFGTANSFCYNDSASNCAKYGRLYTWAAALDACPTDWHLPDSTEWNYLIDITGGELEAGTSLKSIRASSDAVIDNGSDEYGFSAVAAGSFENNSAYRDLNTLAYFWSSSERSTTVARMLELSYRFSNAVLGGEAKSVAISVRCLKNGNEIPKSSSSVSSSSSKASWAYLNPAISYGEITDDRDGQVYKTVEIGEQTWMAENLNYEIEPYKQNYEVVQSFCYNDSAKYCEKYGRLYTWDAAKRACPTDWRLPTNVEFEELFSAVGGQSIAGKMLRAFGDNSCCVGTNDYGFSGLPAGMWSDYDNQYVGEGSETNFWSSVKYDDSRAYYMMLWDASKYAYLDDPSELNRLDFYKNHGKSVRCIKK